MLHEGVGQFRKVTMKRQASVKNMVESVTSQFFVDCEPSVHVGLRRTLVCDRGGGVEQSAIVLGNLYWHHPVV